MKIFDLVNGYENCEMQTAKDRFLKDHIKVEQYIPYISKVYIAKKIVNDSTYNKDGNIHIDSTVRYLSTCSALIQLYTNIERDTTTIIDTDGEQKEKDTEWAFEYDALKRSGILEKLIANDADSIIPYSEIIEFNTILNMVYDDTLKNEYEIHAFIDKRVNILKDTIKTASEPLIDALIDKMSEIDDENFTELVGLFLNKMNV